MRIMYGFLLVMSISIVTVSPFFAFAQAEHKDNRTTETNGIEITLPDVSVEEMKETRPGGINEQDVEYLLNFMGLRLTKEGAEAGDQRTVNHLGRLGRYNFGSMAGHQIKNFHIEALVFYAAIGASMFRTAYTDSLMKGGRTDPIWAQNLLHEMTSPIGVFSFFCFVIVSGQTNVFYSKALTGFEFKKGPFKGRRIRGWMEPAAIHSKLAGMRANAVRGATGSAAAYMGARSGIRMASSLGGPLGMSMGMLASNIVHEIDYAFSISPHFTPCKEYLMGDISPNANDDLHCDLLYTESRNTVKTWGPGVVSLVTASFLSHALVNTVYAGGFAAARNIKNVKITGPFLKGLTVKTSSRMATGALVGGALSLVPIPVLKGAQAGAQGAISAISWLGRRFLPGGLGFRFLNLYAFMEMDALVTYRITDWLWTRGMKAGAVSDSISDFAEYRQVNDNIPALDCKEGGSDCEYHDSILSAHKVALHFDGWRQYKMQLPMMAHQNWFQYVSNALASVSAAKDVYKLFFLARETGATEFNKTVYFNGHDPENTELAELERIQEVFGGMLKIIDRRLTEEEITEPEGLNLKVVSDSPSRFLKPIEQLNIRDRDRIFVLRRLFSAVNSQAPLNQFYDDWNQIFNKEKEELIKLLSQGEVSAEDLGLGELAALAEDNLRKRVLAAGVEYLNRIIETEQEVNRRGFYGHILQVDNLDGFPIKVQNAYRWLSGTDKAVFADLYKETFIKKDPDTAGYSQIVSYPRGMDAVINFNSYYKQLEEIYNMDFHPDQVRSLRTPGMMDFIVASALCGPDPGQNSGLSEQRVVELINKGDIDTLMNEAPVFSGSVFSGASYTFYPPRIVNMDERLRTAICGGIYKKTGVSPLSVENIYDSYFPVQSESSNLLFGLLRIVNPVSEGAYSNLLHLVLDHVGLEGVSSAEEFNGWWDEKIQPYISLFEEAANREYKAIVEAGFTEPLFQNEMEEEKVHFSSDSSDQSVDEILIFSKGEVREGEVVKSGFVREHGSFYLPAGVFHNMSFEARYWSDMIIHFIQKKTIKPETLEETLSLFDREPPESCSSRDTLPACQKELKELLQDKLSLFGRGFIPPESCSSRDTLPACQSWIKDVLKAGGMQNLLRGIALLVNINPDAFDLTEGDLHRLSEEQIKRIQRNSISAFSCDSQIPTPINAECAPTPLLQQLLNFSYLRLNQILESAIHYAQYIEYISEQVPDVPVPD